MKMQASVVALQAYLLKKVARKFVVYCGGSNPPTTFFNIFFSDKHHARIRANRYFQKRGHNPLVHTNSFPAAFYQVEVELSE